MWLSPLVFVIGLSIIKEALEDIRRFRADMEVNNRKVKTLSSIPDPDSGLKTWETRRWKRLRVGDIVQVEKNSRIPADLVFLTADGEKDICYVETSNLDGANAKTHVRDESVNRSMDKRENENFSPILALSLFCLNRPSIALHPCASGETNLKTKKALLGQSALPDHHSLSKFYGIVECEPPNAGLYAFNGVFQVPNESSTGTKASIDNENILLRGMELKNTGHIVGLVIYAGKCDAVSPGIHRLSTHTQP